MKKLIVSAFVISSFFVAGFVFAHPPTIAIDTIPDMEFAAFPQAYTVTGTVTHDSSTGPGEINVCRLSSLKVTVSDGVNPVVTILDDATPKTTFGWSPTCAVSDDWSASWSITAAGTYTVSATIKHVGATGSDEEVTIVTEEVIIVDSTAPEIVPTITPDANANGWHNSDVTVSWSVTDPESDITSTSGCDETVLSSDTPLAGTTLTCSATSAGGTSEESVTIKLDKTKPVITGDAVPGANTNRWNNTAVDVSFVCADSLSGVDVNTVAGGMLSSEGTGQSVTNSGACTDMAGNTADSAIVSEINIDMTAPVIAGSRTPDPNSNGWNNTDVTVSFSCAETGAVQSGVDTDTVAGATVSSEGAGQWVTNTGECTDEAGNSASSATVSDINIDKTAPVVTITTPADGALFSFKEVVNALWSATDALSGIDTAVGTTASGDPIDTNPIGLYAYSVTATDLAGNVTGPVTNDYEVVGYSFGNFLAPLNLARKDFNKLSIIPVKFQLFGLGGGYIPDAIAQLWVDGMPAVSSGGSNSTNYFRYDPVANQYIFNLSTKMPVLTIGLHTLRATLDDGSSYEITIRIK